ncbi:3-hydroxyacyl-CoA dehydrogenase PaaH [Marinomonas spartinae]|uniref:3-hydroxyacyl-CoA dehydrogenase PaaH n=1 Tax=Marinomonas spartinae TaxID=1792290 RepID=UPI0027BAED9C|nr:3-hydroxyacyl-CoA dehydrogenase PaaH [Marinomonas spartinae]
MMAALDKSMMIGVIGAGAMGAGIAQVAAQSGHLVKLYDNRADAAKETIASIEKQLKRLVERKKFTLEQVQQTVANLQVANELADFEHAGLVIEAIVENRDVKQAVFAELESICSAQCILATNTSSISITRLAAGMKHPERMVGMHFFNPAPIMKLVEVVSGLVTSKEIATTVFDTAAAWGKVPVYAASTPGFIVNRVARPFYAESLRLKQEQVADCATLDALMREAGGFRMGAFELTDLIGQDVNYAVTCSVFDAYYGDFRFQPSLIQKDLVDAGYLGRKSGEGFYSYKEGAVKPEPHCVPPSHHPAPSCVAMGNLDALSALVMRLSGSGITVDQDPSSPLNVLKIGDATVVLTDGRMASERANSESLENLVLVDLALDYQKTTHLALSRAHNTPDDVFQQVVDAFFAVGIKVSEVADSPALVVMRTVAMLANEAADAVLNGVSSVEGVDNAMRYGVNYPLGPLAWADRIGIDRVQQVLNALQTSYGEDRYRTSLLLKRLSDQGRGFYENK